MEKLNQNPNKKHTVIYKLLTMSLTIIFILSCSNEEVVTDAMVEAYSEYNMKNVSKEDLHVKKIGGIYLIGNYHNPRKYDMGFIGSKLRGGHFFDLGSYCNEENIAAAEPILRDFLIRKKNISYINFICDSNILRIHYIDYYPVSADEEFEIPCSSRD